MENEYVYEIYKLVYKTIVREVDEYWTTLNTPPLYLKEFPTREMAEKHLLSITEASDNPNTRRWPQAPHSYYVARVECSKTFVKTIYSSEDPSILGDQ